jgi:hypothetical protein
MDKIAVRENGIVGKEPTVKAFGTLSRGTGSFHPNYQVPFPPQLINRVAGIVD